MDFPLKDCTDNTVVLYSDCLLENAMSKKGLYFNFKLSSKTKTEQEVTRMLHTNK